MSRILNRQRQLAEQGRLRLGYTVPATAKDGKPTTRPVRSETWIVTSHSREHIEHAATLWGGQAEEWEPMGNGAKQWRVITQANAIPAILPTGDPLTQAYEQWSKGGCQRRCDGVTEELSGSPCICLAQHSDQWYELSARQVCVSKSRLKVLLPDMPGLGSWRMETGSFYATDEIAGMVDTIRGAIGESLLVPVTLRIEPRTRVAGGQTKQFVVPVVELRGVTAGALLSGQAIEMRQLTTGNPESATPLAVQAAQTEPSPWVPFFEQVAKAAKLDDLAALWDLAKGRMLVGPQSTPSAERAEFLAKWKAKASELKAAQDAADAAVAAQPDEDGAYPADIVPDPTTPPSTTQETALQDPDAIWQGILAAAGDLGLTTTQLNADFLKRMGIAAPVASGPELAAYLTILTEQGAA